MADVKKKKSIPTAKPSPHQVTIKSPDASDSEDEGETPFQTPVPTRIPLGEQDIAKQGEPETPKQTVSPGQIDSSETEQASGSAVQSKVPPTPPPQPKEKERVQKEQEKRGSLGRSSRAWSSAPALTHDQKKEASPIIDKEEEKSETGGSFGTDASDGSITQDAIADRLFRLNKTGIKLEEFDNKSVQGKHEVSAELLAAADRFMPKQLYTAADNQDNAADQDTTSSGEAWK